MIVDAEDVRSALRRVAPPEILGIANGYFLRRMLGTPIAADWHCAITWLINNWGESARVCDVGCGVGVFMLHLRALGLRNLVASDHDARKLAVTESMFRAFKLEPPEMVQADLCEGVTGGVQCDVVTAFDFIYEHASLLGRLLDAAPARQVIVSAPDQMRATDTRVQLSEAHVQRVAEKHGWSLKHSCAVRLPGMVTHVLEANETL